MAGIRCALDWAGLDFSELDAVSIGWNPAINLEKFDTAQSQRARYLGELYYNVANHLMTLRPGADTGNSRQVISFEGGGEMPIHFITHHLSHAAAFLFGRN